MSSTGKKSKRTSFNFSWFKKHPFILLSNDFEGHGYICALHPTPEGQNSLILSRQRQNFKMITSMKHEGYISVWARVRSTRVPNIIHHEGRGCNAYKDKRDRSFKILRYF